MTLEEYILEADRRGFKLHSMGEYHDTRPEKDRPVGWEMLEGWRVSLRNRDVSDVWAIGYGRDFYLAFERAFDDIAAAKIRYDKIVRAAESWRRYREQRQETPRQSTSVSPAKVKPTIDDLLGALK